MPARRLPRSDRDRIKALVAAKMTNDALSASHLILNAATTEKLNALVPELETKMALRGAALAKQGASTSELNAKRTLVQTYISHFIQSFNNGIVRGMFTVGNRALYGLAVSSNSIPIVNSESKTLSWGYRIIEGDAARVALGGAAMAMPTIEEFTAVFEDYVSCHSAHSTLKDAYEQAQRAVDKLRPVANKLILRIWNEVETYYCSEEPSSIRRHARLWGVKYIKLHEEYSISGTVTDTNNAPVKAARVRIAEADVATRTNAKGEYILAAVADGSYTVIVSKANYLEKRINGVIVVGGEVRRIDVVLVGL